MGQQVGSGSVQVHSGSQIWVGIKAWSKIGSSNTGLVSPDGLSSAHQWSTTNKQPSLASDPVRVTTMGSPKCPIHSQSAHASTPPTSFGELGFPEVADGGGNTLGHGKAAFNGGGKSSTRQRKTRAQPHNKVQSKPHNPQSKSKEEATVAYQQNDESPVEVTTMQRTPGNSHSQVNRSGQLGSGRVKRVKRVRSGQMGQQVGSGSVQVHSGSQIWVGIKAWSKIGSSNSGLVSPDGLSSAHQWSTTNKQPSLASDPVRVTTMGSPKCPIHSQSAHASTPPTSFGELGFPEVADGGGNTLGHGKAAFNGGGKSSTRQRKTRAQPHNKVQSKPHNPQSKSKEEATVAYQQNDESPVEVTTMQRTPGNSHSRQLERVRSRGARTAAAQKKTNEGRKGCDSGTREQRPRTGRRGVGCVRTGMRN
ncbi:hypothetical protein GQ457_13G011000 [Hibiscus cannabinus]